MAPRRGDPGVAAGSTVSSFAMPIVSTVSMRSESRSWMCLTVFEGDQSLYPISLQRRTGRRVPRRAFDARTVRARVRDASGLGQPTKGATNVEALPANARRYLETLEELCGVPVEMVSTGPDRDSTIVDMGRGRSFWTAGSVPENRIRSLLQMILEALQLAQPALTKSPQTA